MKLKYSTTSIFESDCEGWVNPVNTVGVMGAGLALGFKTRFPPMFSEYKRICELGHLICGQCWVYEETSPAKPDFIVLFPTKQDWKEPSKLEWIKDGLEDLEGAVDYWKIKSISLPYLGCGLGGLSVNDVEPLIKDFAEKVQCKVVLHKVKL